jgi:lambda repressor-like predicted transcriptional regulator
MVQPLHRVQDGATSSLRGSLTQFIIRRGLYPCTTHSTVRRAWKKYEIPVAVALSTWS